MYLFRYIFCNKIIKSSIKRLYQEFSKIDFIDTSEMVGASLEWNNNLNELKNDISRRNILNFLNWHVVKRTMVVDIPDYIPTEFQSVLNNEIFREYWRKGLVENQIGNPIKRKELGNSSGNLVHHLYHLTEYYNFSKKLPKDFSIVFEFGGGYGSMCRLFHNLSFEGKYIIFDFPHFNAVQNFYLSCNGIRVRDFSEFHSCSSGVFLVSDVMLLKSILTKQEAPHQELFIGTWSLSETDELTRSAILPLIKNFKNQLIAFQKSFGEVDNVNYFNNYNSQFDDLKSLITEIEHLKGNYYNFISN